MSMLVGHTSIWQETSSSGEWDGLQPKAAGGSMGTPSSRKREILDWQNKRLGRWGRLVGQSHGSVGQRWQAWISKGSWHVLATIHWGGVGPWGSCLATPANTDASGDLFSSPFGGYQGHWPDPGKIEESPKDLSVLVKQSEFSQPQPSKKGRNKQEKTSGVPAGPRWGTGSPEEETWLRTMSMLAVALAVAFPH